MGMTGNQPRYLIVGGAGYFGARLAETLAKTCRVTITQRSSSAIRDGWVLKHGLDSIPFDSATMDTLPVEGGFDAIINLAMPGAAEAARAPEAAIAQGLATADACVRLLDEGRASRLVHFSTFHVYGSTGRGEFCETDTPAPTHPYGRAHLACEQHLANDERTWIVRPSNLVGAPAHADLGSQARLMFVDLCQQAARGAMKLHNDGLSHRDFLPFDDAMHAVQILLGAAPQPQRLFNLARGVSMRLDEAAFLIQAAAPTPPAVQFGEGKDDFRQPFEVSIERLARLGWRPGASLADEAARLIQFFS